MTADEIEAVAARAAKAAVRETLLMLGVDSSDGKAIKEMQADFMHLRSTRLASAMVWSRAYLTATGVVVSGLMGTLYLFFANRGH